MRKKYIYAFIVCTAVFFISDASVQYSARPPFNYTGADGSTCAQCHGNFNTGGGSIITSGLPAAGFIEGQQYNFSITLSHPATRGRWGFSIAARDANNQPVGSFSSSNPNAAPNGTELSHSMAVFQTGNVFTYDNLRWTAPVNPTAAQKTVTFYYIGNAANGDMGPSGDFIYSGTAHAVWISSNHPPVVTITDPASGAAFNAGSTITIKAAASDSDGTVSKVELFYIDSTAHKLGEDLSSPYEFTGADVEPGNYRLLAKAIDDDSAAAFSDTLNITVSSCTGAGSISVYGYTNIAGSLLINLANSANYPGNPDIVTQLNKFEYGPDVLDNYGGKVRGYICAPQTGNYTFYIASDDQSELWLSTDDHQTNIRRIAYVESRVGYRSWLTYPTQRSAPVRLIKGAKYYIEAVHKEGSGTDHLSVGWVLPNGIAERPIPGNRLIPWETNIAAGGGVFEDAMRNADDPKASSDGLTVTVKPNPSTSSFTFITKTGSNQPLMILITDVMGRVVERKLNVPANTTIQAGQTLRPGIYFARIIQGEHQKSIKLIRE